jgi:hypothetical protein
MNAMIRAIAVENGFVSFSGDERGYHRDTGPCLNRESGCRLRACQQAKGSLNAIGKSVRSLAVATLLAPFSLLAVAGLPLLPVAVPAFTARLLAFLLARFGYRLLW